MISSSVLQLRPEPMTDTAPTPTAAKPGRQAKMTIRGLRKTFNDAVIYDGFDLDLPLGQFISVFGPNGCGKSTLINMISGLMPMDAGEVLYDGQRISETRISYVFQNYREALFPWLRAIDNIHYPLKVMGVPRAERKQRIEKLLAEFEIRIDLNAYPYTLSGGQQQTVSILRALVTEPEVLFLDEPFSALDYEMTMSMREQLQKIFMKTKTTMLLVSHDLDEAIEQADKLVLLTRRPTKVAEIVEIGLPWPRDRAVTTGDAFMALKRHCLDRFWQEVKK
ncbi:Aliphatic sulfonates import ATP-binding protein SsuB [Rhodopseudomonas palustris]|uniref:Nitrate transport system ATP-binding protein n=2 Tax=Rhodopseudomonas palustris (strain ATCC BAA-98 / CGA009) TaxID=258594 RepID=Q6N4F2_RHOPA|nr:nitrate ABC transporter ATP-binding protein [Rhodopseudomonas palustris]PPQ44109.1 nitrate ABC transporter ATP-binding protein [Rhodopseudomonas palustris]QQM04921.1 Aliphatic sulfonates import ATP-binding protein SsuB [Rhodopseudomonas palustris]RJF65062.1 ATP-binding cassette domain-containing protein [Rhodopseudomonas palustris]CAE28826.1 putative nitrate transport system ATP-binding protein [Rhodopseudomonas palustris CGA009]